ncbi:hypothetical protein RM543_01955 [Roseicyclus sp. F158]|uniref:DUF1795 domain-containing protein n=1 Tax=Tropicimonas omnivorans TaxID=3075590 RepID=A0ABU3DCZ3_9RHOB|nr:hypothetical protein [Roseicyclus sp. F158]MDT0681433.1 hypothetical protein [Roseicyclus sp. F158]
MDIPVPFLTSLTIPADQLRGTLVQVPYVNPGAPEFGFTVNVPANWDISTYPEEAPSPDLSPRLLLHASPDAGRQIELCIFATVLTREVNPVDWADGWLELGGQGIVEARTWKTEYGILIDALTHATDRDVKGVRRFMTIKDGPRLFVIEARIRAEDAGAANFVQNVLLAAIQSFALSRATKERFAEPFDMKALPGRVPLVFPFPSSWEESEIPDAPEGGSGLLLDNAGAGSILVVSAPGCDASEEIEDAALDRIGARIDVKRMDDAYIAVPRSVMNVISRQGIGQQGDAMVTLVTGRIETPDVSAAAILVAPSQDTSPQGFAIARRAFEVLVEEMQPAR